MALLKPIENGRMYPGWWRWNPIPGCKHACSYCYMQAMSKCTGKDMLTPIGLREDYMNDNLGSGRKIFVCSSGDMWGYWVNNHHILDVLKQCEKYPDNIYMFLTKNPYGYRGWAERLDGANYILGATIETDRMDIAAGLGEAPNVLRRIGMMAELGSTYPKATTMISLEPVVKFSLEFANMLRFVAPDVVYIGVDSGNNGLSEPEPDELRGLIKDLKMFTDVRLKKGIERILPEYEVSDG